MVVWDICRYLCGLKLKTVRSRIQTFWDVSSRAKERPLWRHYYPNTQGIAYVVDSNDWHRMTEAKEFRHDILSEDELKGVPVAITLNKRYLKNCMRKEEMEKG